MNSNPKFVAHTAGFMLGSEKVGKCIASLSLYIYMYLSVFAFPGEFSIKKKKKKEKESPPLITATYNILVLGLCQISQNLHTFCTYKSLRETCNLSYNLRAAIYKVTLVFFPPKFSSWYNISFTFSRFSFNVRTRSCDKFVQFKKMEKKNEKGERMKEVNQTDLWTIWTVFTIGSSTKSLECLGTVFEITFSLLEFFVLRKVGSKQPVFY